MDKCEVCRRKTHFIVTCRCGKVTCIQHRDPEDHACSFDYKEKAKIEIANNNPKINSQKVEVV